MISAKFGISIVAIAMFTAGAVQAADTDGDPKAGKDKSGMCQGCHGETGMSMAPNFPHLAGQYQRYIERQVRDYQTAKRTDPIMSGMAAGVTDPQDLSRLGEQGSPRSSMLSGPRSLSSLPSGESTR